MAGIGKTGGGAGGSWVNRDPALRFDDAAFAHLLAYWEAKRAGRVLPSRADIDPLELKPHLGHLCLVEVHHPPLRMRYRLIGTAITRAMSRDVTGRWYHDIYKPDLLREAELAFAWIVEQRRPLRTWGRSFAPDKGHFDYEMLDLPLGRDGRTVDMVLSRVVYGIDR